MRVSDVGLELFLCARFLRQEWHSEKKRWVLFNSSALILTTFLSPGPSPTASSAQLWTHRLVLLEPFGYPYQGPVVRHAQAFLAASISLTKILPLLEPGGVHAGFFEL